MSILVKATPAPKPRSREAVQMSFLYSGILVVFAVAQLFTFDEFIELIPALGLPLAGGLVYLLAPLIVVAEIFAIPFLLRMQLSVAFRWLSMVLGWFVPFFWFFVSVWVLTTRPIIDTIGFLGTAVNLTPGWWAPCIALALGILAAWTSWGLWPGQRKK